MIEKQGDLLTVKRGIIVHGCNSRGVMGSGIAKSIKNRYPGAYDAYRNKAKDQNFSLDMGDVIYHNVNDDLVIANAITQKDYYGYKGDYSDKVWVDYDAIRDSFSDIYNLSEDRKDSSLPYEIFIPLLGAGLGGGDWERIKGIIEEESKEIPVTLYKL